MQDTHGQRIALLRPYIVILAIFKYDMHMKDEYLCKDDNMNKPP